MAARFAKMSKNTAYNYAASLVADGWFKVVKESERLPNGRMSKAEYYVLSHEEWAAEYPGSCHQPAQKKGQEPAQKQGQEPAQILNTTSPNSDQSQPKFWTAPAQEEGHNLQLPTHTKKQTGTTDTAARPSPSFFRAFLPETERKRGSAPSQVARPAQKEGQAVSVTPPASLTPELKATAGAINGRLGETLGLHSKPWELAVSRLAARGFNGDTILAAFNRYCDQRSEQYVRQHLSHGFEQAFESVLREMNAEQNTEAA